MREGVDRKDTPVPVAEYRYRHEAEFAAGFLSDAGIPYRLQIDDAGGADLGLSLLRPAVLWVREVDVQEARELIAWEDGSDSLAEGGLERRSLEARSERLESGGKGLSLTERGVSAGLSTALLAGAPLVPPGEYRGSLVALCVVGGLACLGAALAGRAPGLLGGVLRALAGSPPR